MFKKWGKFILAGLLTGIFSVIILSGCHQPPAVVTATEVQLENLTKLCKVWGFVKYTHPVFILGQKDWDKELLTLLPKVYQAATPEETNILLHEWFTSLGDCEYPDTAANNDDTTYAALAEYISAEDAGLRVSSDGGWRQDEASLGAALCADLARLGTIPPEISREKAPVFFDEYGHSSFANEKKYARMNYRRWEYRLLGLFRFFNAVEYHSPYQDVLEGKWEEPLDDYILQMLTGTDRQSYLLTLAKMSTALHDNHVQFTDESFLDAYFGKYVIPVRLFRSGDLLVIGRVLSISPECPLKPGDVLTAFNGNPIDEIIADRLQYLPVPDYDRLLMKLTAHLLRSPEKTMEVTVLRENTTLTLEVPGYANLRRLIQWRLGTPSLSHERLAGNIGLINPELLEEGEIHQIMAEFSDTEGLIIDLRQTPTNADIQFTLAEYLVNPPRQYALMAIPNPVLPGTFVDYLPFFISGYEYYPGQETTPTAVPGQPYFYEKKIVILMSETTQSKTETAVMSLRNAPGAVVMGEISSGANGDTVFLPLPGGNMIRFTNFGCYTAEGDQVLRTGLAPDIYVEPTVAGIREGRDELMEAAVAYLTE